MERELVDTLAGALALLAVTTKMIEVLIATHPDPQALYRAWRAQLPASVDAEIDTPPFGVQAYREAFVQGMGDLSTLIANHAGS